MTLVTAVRALRVVGGLAPGQTVLVHAGASGTGTMLVQVARALGARVATTVRTASKASAVEALGAELAVVDDPGDPGATDRRLSDWAAGRGLDVVVGNHGGPSLARSVSLLRPLGTVVLMDNVLGLESTLPVRSVFFPQVRIVGTLMGDRDDLEWGLSAVADGRIRAVVDRVYAPGDASAAHERLAAGTGIGVVRCST